MVNKRLSLKTMMQEDRVGLAPQDWEIGLARLSVEKTSPEL